MPLILELDLTPLSDTEAWLYTNVTIRCPYCPCGRATILAGYAGNHCDYCNQMVKRYQPQIRYVFYPPFPEQDSPLLLTYRRAKAHG